MTRTTALVAGIVALVATLAQDLYPYTEIYHAWQYALVLAAAIVVLVGFAWAAFRAKEHGAALAALGCIVVALDGLTVGLIGPDTETIARAPGTVQPLPDLRAAAFFAATDRTGIADGSASVLVRRRNAPDLPVPEGTREYLGTSVLYTEPQRAAYVVARTKAGDRLTVTQPSGTAFLSPVLLFPKQQTIAKKTYRYDQFALPAEHRVINALYFSSRDLQTAGHTAGIGPGTDAVLFGVNDDNGGNVALGFDPSGKSVLVGDVRLTATLGTYPELVIASGPEPIALGIGLALMVAGFVMLLVVRGKRTQPTP